MLEELGHTYFVRAALKELQFIIGHYRQASSDQEVSKMFHGIYDGSATTEKFRINWLNEVGAKTKKLTELDGRFLTISRSVVASQYGLR